MLVAVNIMAGRVFIKCGHRTLYSHYLLGPGRQRAQRVLGCLLVVFRALTFCVAIVFVMLRLQSKAVKQHKSGLGSVIMSSQGYDLSVCLHTHRIIGIYIHIHIACVHIHV